MGLRQAIHDKPSLAYGLISIILVVLILLLSFRQNSSSSKQAYFYDLNTGQLTVAIYNGISPAPQSTSLFSYPEGEAGAWVRAAVYTCADQPVQLHAGMTQEQVIDAGGRIAWLERYPADVLDLIVEYRRGTQLTAHELQRISQAPKLIASPKDMNWVIEDSVAGQRIIQSLAEICPSDRPTFITP